MDKDMEQILNQYNMMPNNEPNSERIHCSKRWLIWSY